MIQWNRLGLLMCNGYLEQPKVLTAGAFKMLATSPELSKADVDVCLLRPRVLPPRSRACLLMSTQAHAGTLRRKFSKYLIILQNVYDAAEWRGRRI